ncbi:MAG: hypothetical protein EA391_05405 [Balneolaceae bacterium]|nr:MAG: hypothetical protein EA391_05405 [Balneolaceae bacterium]
MRMLHLKSKMQFVGGTMKNRVFYTFFTILILFTTTDLLAQTGALRVSIQGPEAASLGQYGDVPVGLYSGTANIQIPIHQAESRLLSLPISLQYNASGIKVEAIPSWVGSGWTLNATGVITRSIRGLPDEDIYGYYNQGHTLYENNNWSIPPSNYLQDISLGNIDSEPDIFYFNFGGRSGQFILGPKNEYGQGIAAIRTIPNEKLVVEPFFIGGDNLYKWIITTEDGTKYTFQNTEVITEQVSVLTGVDPENNNEYISSWFLTEIDSPSGDDKIEFNYAGYSASHELNMFEEEFTYGGSCRPSDKKIQTTHHIGSQRLVSISTGAETIYFDASERSDGEYQLDSLRVKTKNGVLKKQLNFLYSSRTDRLFLESLDHIPVDGETDISQTYSFTYHSTQLPGRLSNSIDHWGYFNGKSNGSSLIPELSLNSQKWGSIYLNGADRSPSFSHMQAGILTKITYPTGGSSEFIYEPNDYASVSGQDPAHKIMSSKEAELLTEYNVHFTSENSKQVVIGGEDPVTVQVLVNFEPNNDCGGIGDCYVHFAGNYYSNSNPNGFPAMYNIVVQPGTHVLKAVSPEYQNAFAYIKIMWEESTSVNNVPDIPGITGGGLRIKEIINYDGLENQSIKKFLYRRFSENKEDQSSGVILTEPRYHYDTVDESCEFISRSTFTRLPLGLSNNSIGYTEVTVLNDWDPVLETANGGKSVHFFRTAEETPETSYSLTDWPFAPRNSREWERGQEIKTEYYDNNEELLKSVEFGYTFERIDPEVVRQYLALSYKVVYHSSDPNFGWPWDDLNGVHTSYIVESGWMYLNSKTVRTFSNSGQNEISAGQQYVYENTSHLNPTKIIESNSDGSERVTEFVYAHEITNDGTSKDYSNMASLNMLSQPYSTTVKGVGGQVLARNWIRWDNPGGVWRPKEEWVWDKETPGDNPTTATANRQVTWNSYDVWGNPLQYTDANNQVVNMYYGSHSNPLSQNGLHGTNGVYLTGVERVKPGGSNLTTTGQYNTRGFLTRLVDVADVETRYDYDGLGRLKAISNASDVVIQDYDYNVDYSGGIYDDTNANSIRVRSFTNSQTRTSTQYFDGLGRPIQSQAYDGTHSIVSVLEYDSQGREWKAWKTYRDSGANSYRSNVSSGSDGFREQLYEASPLNRLAKTIPEGGESLSGSVDLGYEVRSWNGSNWLVTTTTDEEGKTAETWSDGWGRTVRTITDPGGLNVQTRFVYDELDRLTTVYHPNHFSETGDWQSEYEYNPRGELIKRITQDSGTTELKYDASGNLRYSQDANQAGNSMASYTTWDFANRPLVEGVAIANFSNLNPDVDPAFESDSLNWKGVHAWDEKPSTSTYPWSEFSSLIDTVQMVNTKGHLVGRAWKFGGEEAEESVQVNGEGINGSASYQASGTITVENTVVEPSGSLTLRANETITLKPGFHAESGSSVNATIGSVSGDGISSIAGENPWQIELFKYDEEGRVTDKWIWTGDRRDWDTHLAYEYNRLGEVITMMVEVGDPSVNTEILYQHYEYNPLGQLHKVFLSTSGSYDSQNDDPEVTYTYTPTGAIDKILYDGGKEADYDYNIRDWVTSINSVSSPGGNFAALYQYQKNGNIAMSRFFNPDIDLSSSHNDYRYVYSYDNLSRLTGADYRYGSSGTVSSWFDVAGLNYDSNGNILSLQRRDDTGTLVDNLTYNYGANNRLSSVLDAAGQHHNWDAFTSSFIYDDNGNMISQSGKFTNIAYDHRNLPIHFYLDNDDELIANYNAEGQRIIKESSGGGWSFYVTEGMQTLAVVTEQGLSHMNLVGNSTFGRIEADNGNIMTSNARRYYITDHLGSTRAVVGNDGLLKETHDYYPFGLTMPGRSKGEALTREQFTGQLRDNEPGFNLDYFKARYYDPAMGRFLSVDPYADLFPDQSPYNYVYNNPLLYSDPTGKYPDCNTQQQCLDRYASGAIIENTIGKFEIDDEGNIITHELYDYEVEQTVNHARPDHFAATVTALPTVGRASRVPVVGQYIAGGVLLGFAADAAYKAITFNQQETFTTTVHAYTPAPRVLPGFPGAYREGHAGGRTRWKTPDGLILEWDSQHGELEVYDRRGRHKGSFDHETGEQIKDPVPGRRTRN